MKKFKPLPKGYKIEHVKDLFLIQPLHKEMLALDVMIKSINKKEDKKPLELKFSELKTKLNNLMGLGNTTQPAQEEVQDND